jgi:hypothetical protein
MTSEPADDLIDVITTWLVGMPVRAMERLLSRGVSSVHLRFRQKVQALLLGKNSVKAPWYGRKSSTSHHRQRLIFLAAHL